jgi:hypothetical protein
LTATERHVALTLSLHMSERGDSCFPSMETLVDETGRGKSTVREALRQMDELGWLERTITPGRGRANEYRAVIPATWINRQHPAPNEVGDDHEDAGPHQQRDREQPVADESEKRQLLAGNEDGKSASSGGEKRQLTNGKAPGAGPQDVRRASEDAAAAAGALAAGDAAAARDLDKALRAIGVGQRLRLRALGDPHRARAWLELANKAADTNPAGFFRVGFESGDWPSERRDAAGFSRARWVEQTSWQLEPEEAHAIVDDWRDLDHTERGALHDRVDEVRAEREAGAEALKRVVDETEGRAA